MLYWGQVSGTRQYVINDITITPNKIPIVALCGSAGGLPAFQAFFEAVPAEPEMAFVILQHQAAQYESILVDILQRHTPIPVVAIASGMPLQANRVHVCPPSVEVTLANGHFQTQLRSVDAGWPRSIDRLLLSLAEDQGERVVAVIMSGAGKDGTDGARAVLKHGGRVIVQEPTTAGHPAMPQNIIENDLADAALPPEQMPDFIYSVFGPPIHLPPAPPAADITEDDLQRVVWRIRRQTGRNFTDYKTSTMRRQVARRMAQLGVGSVGAYLDYMHAHPGEADNLVRYLLIHVTSFFRDPEAFEALKTEALLPLLRQMDVDRVFRAWVPGCASGEEAISIAILIYECLRELDMVEMEVRIFATDANRQLIRQARDGLYPKAIAADITPARLHDNFVLEGDGYRVRSHILRMLIWSEHNMVEQPPFSRMDLISCRNVLIYFQKRLQDRVLALFQFALGANGVLFLGSSETIPANTNAFAAIDHKHKLYRRVTAQTRPWVQLDYPLFENLTDSLENAMPGPPPNDPPDNNRELRLVQDALLEHVNATCLLIDPAYHLLFSYGEVDRFLSVLPGKNRQRVLEMAREGLAVDLTVVLHEAFENDDQTIKRPGVWVRTNGDERIVTLTVIPVRDEVLGHRARLVIIETQMQGRDLRDTPSEDVNAPNTTTARLRAELAETKEALRSTTQALQAKSEELTTSIEEIRSANEEVQTTNEELRTSQEELESMNEELNTLNTQLTEQNTELTQANNTLHNFIQSAEIGMIILDPDLSVREFTNAATGLFRLRREDRGRPLTDITHQLDYPDMLQDAAHVMRTLETVEKEVAAQDERWFTVHIRPYRTTNNLIDGLVLTFTDITAQIQARQTAEGQVHYMRQVFDMLGDSVLELDGALRVVAANAAFYETFQVSAAATIGRQLYDLGNGQWDIPDLRHLLTEVIPAQTVVQGYEVTHQGNRVLKS